MTDNYVLTNSVTPSSLTFQAYCSENSRTYAVGPATGIPGSATQLIWDPTELSHRHFILAKSSSILKNGLNFNVEDDAKLTLILPCTRTTVGAFPYAQATYQLKVFDERGPTALPVPGRFWGGNAIVVFAMYTPAAYTPLSQGEYSHRRRSISDEKNELTLRVMMKSLGWKCVGCSWANPSTTWSHLLIALPVTIALVLIGGAGVFRY